MTRHSREEVVRALLFAVSSVGRYCRQIVASVECHRRKGVIVCKSAQTRSGVPDLEMRKAPFPVEVLGQDLLHERQRVFLRLRRIILLVLRFLFVVVLVREDDLLSAFDD